MGPYPTRGNEMAVILSEAKDLQFQSGANQCRFFASLRMTAFERVPAACYGWPDLRAKG